jgi:hypothetical protein
MVLISTTELFNNFELKCSKIIPKYCPNGHPRIFRSQMSPHFMANYRSKEQQHKDNGPFWFWQNKILSKMCFPLSPFLHLSWTFALVSALLPFFYQQLKKLTGEYQGEKSW